MPTAASHPERFVASRPYADLLHGFIFHPASAGAFLGTSPPQASEHTLLRAIRAAITEALVQTAAPPLRDYNERLRFVCSEAQDASYYLAFCLDGHRILPIEWRRLEWGWAASQASVGKPPSLTGSVYLHFDLPAPIYLANGCELDGAYVGHHPEYGICRALLAPKADISWPNPSDHGDAFCLDLSDPRRTVGEIVDNALTQAEVYLRDVAFNATMPHGLFAYAGPERESRMREYSHARHESTKRSLGLVLAALRFL